GRIENFAQSSSTSTRRRTSDRPAPALFAPGQRSEVSYGEARALPGRRYLTYVPQCAIDRHLQSFKPGGIARFAARDEDRLSIRCPQQPPTISRLHAHAIDVVDDSAFPAQALADLFDHAEFLRIRTGEPNFRGIDDRGPVAADLGKRSTLLAQDP